jgi:hypothetical protein
MTVTREKLKQAAWDAAGVIGLASLPFVIGQVYRQLDPPYRIKLDKLGPGELLDARAGLFMHEVNKAPTRQELGVLIEKFRPIFGEIEKSLPQEGRIPRGGGKIVLSGGESSPIKTEGGFFIDALSLTDFRILTPTMVVGLNLHADPGKGEWISPTAALDLMKELLPFYDQKAQQEGSFSLFEQIQSPP